MKTPTKTAAHCVYNLNYHIVNYHIVLVTKFRNRVLTGDIERFVKEQVPLICARYESSALGTSGRRWPWRSCPNTSTCSSRRGRSPRPTRLPRPSRASCKSILAVAVFREFLTLKARRFWGSGLWSDGCYYGSAGAVSAEIIKCYIESQKDACVKDEVGLDNKRTLMCGRTEDQSR